MIPVLFQRRGGGAAVVPVPAEVTGQTLIWREELWQPSLASGTPGTLDAVSSGTAWGRLDNGPTWLSTPGNQSTRRSGSCAIRQQTQAEITSGSTTFAGSRLFGSAPNVGKFTMWFRPSSGIDFTAATLVDLRWGASQVNQGPWTLTKQASGALRMTLNVAGVYFDLPRGDQWYLFDCAWDTSASASWRIWDTGGTQLFEQEFGFNVAPAPGFSQMRFTFTGSGYQPTFAGRIAIPTAYSCDTYANAKAYPGGHLPPNDATQTTYTVTASGGSTDYAAKTLVGWDAVMLARHRQVILSGGWKLNGTRVDLSAMSRVQRVQMVHGVTGQSASLLTSGTSADGRTYFFTGGVYATPRARTTNGYFQGGLLPAGDIVTLAAGVYRTADATVAASTGDGVKYQAASGLTAADVDIRSTTVMSSTWTSEGSGVWSYDGTNVVNRHVWGAAWQSFSPGSYADVASAKTGLAARDWGCWTSATGKTYISLPDGTTPTDIGPLEGSNPAVPGVVGSGSWVERITSQGTAVYDYADPPTSGKAVANYNLSANLGVYQIAVFKQCRVYRYSKHGVANVGGTSPYGVAVVDGCEFGYAPPPQTAGGFGVGTGDYNQIVDYSGVASGADTTLSKIVTAYYAVTEPHAVDPGDGTATAVAAGRVLYYAHGEAGNSAVIGYTTVESPDANMFSPSSFDGDPTPGSHGGFCVFDPHA